MNSVSQTVNHITLDLSQAKNKISKEGILQIISQTERNQLGNKEIVIKKFYELIHKCFVVQKKRRATKPSKSLWKFFRLSIDT